MADAVVELKLDAAPIQAALRAGIDSAFANLRREFADHVRTVAAKEPDGRVVQRLNEVAALITQDLAGAEAKLAQANPIVHRERAPLGAKPPILGAAVGPEKTPMVGGPAKP